LMHQGMMNCDTEIKDDDTFSDISDMGSKIVGYVYTIQEI